MSRDLDSPNNISHGDFGKGEEAHGAVLVRHTREAQTIMKFIFIFFCLHSLFVNNKPYKEKIGNILNYKNKQKRYNIYFNTLRSSFRFLRGGSSFEYYVSKH